MTRGEGLLAALLALFLLGAPPAVRAQGEPSLQEIELEYDAALSTYLAAVSARDAANSRFNRTLTEFETARMSGDQDRRNRAFSAMRQASIELTRLDARVESTRRTMESAGQDLLVALDRRREELLAQADTLPIERADDRRSLAILVVDLTNQVREVEREVAEARQTEPPGLSEVRVDERDGPEELRIKAQYLEGRVAQYDSTLTDIERRIEELRNRQRTDRRVREFVAGIERFDDLSLPVVAGGPRGETPRSGVEGGEPADTTELAPREVTLEERIEGLQSLRSRVESFRDQAESRAGVIRARLRQGGEPMDRTA